MGIHGRRNGFCRFGFSLKPPLYSHLLETLKMFSNQTIRTKINGASLMIAFLFAIIGVSAITASRVNNQQLSGIEADIRRIDDVAKPLTRAALNMQLDVTEIQQFLTDISATRGLDGLDDGIVEADKNAALFREHIAIAIAFAEQTGDVELKSALRATTSEFDPYLAMGKKMSAAYVANGTAAGNPMMREFDGQADRLRASLDRVVKAADELSALSGREAERSIKALAGAVNSELYLTLFMGLLAIVLTTAVALTMRNSVSQPIHSLAYSMSEIASGKMDSIIPRKTAQDEIGEMARAVEVFRKDAIERLRLTREAQILSEFNDWLQSAKSESELYDMIADVMGRLIPYSIGSLYIYANSRDVLECAKAWNGDQIVETMHPDDCWGLRRGRTYVHTHSENEIRFHCSHAASNTTGEYCCIPILAHGETVGLLHLERKAINSIEDAAAKFTFAEERRMGLACAEQISLAIANIKLREQLRDQSIRDSLTGLYNRRYMMETCQREFARARRTGQTVSLLSLDVDHFKKFNDNHGHDAGDAVLRVVGECLRTSFREDDVPCRFGGEEFVVVLPGATSHDAEIRADELRKRIESLIVRYADGNLPRITMSIGVASFPNVGENPMAVLKAADEALYAAKAAGRNCVQVNHGLAGPVHSDGELPHHHNTGIRTDCCGHTHPQPDVLESFAA
jgi:diguanylate cyclase (GGDEF)-like protein